MFLIIIEFERVRKFAVDCGKSTVDFMTLPEMGWRSSVKDQVEIRVAVGQYLASGRDWLTATFRCHGDESNRGYFSSPDS